MQLIIKVKQPGRKHALMDRMVTIEDVGNNPTVTMLINAVVEQQVNEYNNKPQEKNLVAFLTAAETEEQRVDGKISFGSIYNENKADAEQAKLTAVQAFEDGMFAIFVNDEEIGKASQTINLPEKSVITFIRLTFLAGSYW